MIVSPDLHEILEIPGEGSKLQIILILFQLAAILIGAKLLGALCERIKVPGVIGELVAGVIIGPFLLGSRLLIPLHGSWVPLFPPPHTVGQWPVNQFLWTIAQLGSIVLLFVTGLHTDIRQFLRYMLPASLVALAGAFTPFVLGVAIVFVPFFGKLALDQPMASLLVPALFVGVILMATSTGITARVLGDIEKLDTAEGVTILGAAVVDDVVGIVALAVVGAIASTGTISAGQAGWLIIKAVGIWIILTAVVLALARPLEIAVTRIRYGGTMVAILLAVALVSSGVAESFNLAFIIGAYSAGLGISRTRMAHSLMAALSPINDFLVPIFFATLGMLVNFEVMFSDWRVVFFGLAVTTVAVIGKLIGCGAAAIPAGFNLRGGFRIGLGMLPRGEVALIVAGVGLGQQIIGPNVFAVSIMMTLITTLIAPVLLVRAFESGGSGRWRTAAGAERLPDVDRVGIDVVCPEDFCPLVLSRLLTIAEAHGWEPSYERSDEEIYLLRLGPAAATVRRSEEKLEIDATGSTMADFEKFLSEVLRSIGSDVKAVIAHPDETRAK